MMHTYEAVIGLECHAQLLTKSKLFCSCSTTFGEAPNANTCPVCLGLPGALPVLNRVAVNMAVKAALGLNCKINTESQWARKNYFYPDLPKGYQISQYDRPLAQNGFIEIKINGTPKKIGDQRHTEKDWCSTHPYGRGCRQVFARRVCRFGQVYIPGLQPQWRSARRDRDEPGYSIVARSLRLPVAAQRDSGISRRERRQHGRGRSEERR